jgi:uncharacterized protein YhdP
MKTRLLKMIHYTSIMLVIFLTLLAFSLALLRAVAPLVASEVSRVETLLSNYVKQPVSIHSLTLRWHGFVPIFDAKQVVLWNVGHTQAQLTIGEAEAGFDLWRSLSNRQIILRTVTIKNAHLTFKEQENGQWQIIELASLMPSVNQGNLQLQTVVNKIKPWHHIVLQHIAIDAYPNNQQHWQMQIVLAKWHELYFNRRNVSLQLHLLKPTASQLNIIIHCSGNWQNVSQWKLKVSSQMINVNIAPWQKYLIFNGYQLQQGMINGVIDADWTPHGLQNIFIQSVLNHWRIHDIQQNDDFNLTAAGLDVRGYWSTHDWQLAGDIATASWQRFRQIPGVENLSGKIAITPTQGKFLPDSGDTSLDFGELFVLPLHFKQLQGEIDWQKTAQQGWDIETKKLMARNPDLTVVGSMQLKLRPQQSPWANINAYYHLYPSVVTQLNDYLPRTVLHPALIEWLTKSVKSMEGGEGKLVLRGAVNDFPYIQSPGEFLVDSKLKNIMLDYSPGWPIANKINTEVIFSGNLMEAKVASAELDGIIVKNIDVAIPTLGKSSVLAVHGVIATDTRNILHFIDTSPLRETIGRRLSGINWQGNSQLTLQLQIPLADNAMPSTTQVQGNLLFKQNLLQIPAWKIDLQNLQGQLQFTRDNINGNNLQAMLFNSPITLNINTPQITFTGKLALDQLPPSLVQTLKPYLSGAANYQGDIQLAKNLTSQDQITLTSNLLGTVVQLPPPMAKPANAINKLRINIFAGAAQPSRYIIAYNQLLLTLIQRQAAWEIDIAHPQINGQINWPSNAMREGVNAVFRYCYLQPNAMAQKSLGKLDPAQVPPLNVIVNDFRYNNKQFGIVNFQTQPTNNGLVIRQLQTRLPNYQITAQGQWLRNVNDHSMTTLQGTLQSNDLASMLQSWQLPASVLSKSAKVQFNCQWPDVLYAPSFASLQGSVHFVIDKGRVVNVGSQAKMDIGRLLTLLSFQSIERRLQFDFSDLTQSGLTFDRFSGDFQLADGQATTTNTSLDGSVTHVTMKGSIDLVDETYRLQLRVTPHLTSSLPLIATIAGGPVAGAVTWAASKIVNPVISKITSDDYSVTGSWSQPVIKSL